MKLSLLLFKPRSYVGAPIYAHTLFGAFCWGLAVLYGEEELKKTLERFKDGDPPFLLSSPLPYKEDKLYFPMPILPEGNASIEKEEDYRTFKRLKASPFVEEDTFKKVLRGAIKSQWELAKDLKESLKIEKFLMHHASINRITWTTVDGEFFTETYYAYPTFGVLVKLADESYADILKTVFSFVHIGKNKSSGMGKFEVEWKEPPCWLSKFSEPRGDRFVLISESFYDGDMDLTDSLYDLFTFRGAMENYYWRLTSNLWKKRVLYIKPGSYLKAKSAKPHYGGLKQVLKEGNREVYQYGYGFPLFFKG